MPLGYRNPDKKFLSLIEQMKAVDTVGAEFGRNRFTILESYEKKEFKEVMDKEEAEKILKDLKVEFDAVEEYGGGRVYTLKDEVVAEYLPQFMNITVYQKLQDTLPKPEMPAETPKDSNIVDTQNHPAKESVNEYVKQLAVGGTAQIPTGNAQLVYGIKGTPGEEFKVTRHGTMVPVGTYKVVAEPANQQQVVGKTFSTLTVQKISEDYSSFSGGASTPAATMPGQQKKYVPDARGITNKDVADTIAQQQGGVVANDDQDKGKFMVVQASEDVVDDADKVQGAKETATMLSAVDLKIPESKGEPNYNVYDAKTQKVVHDLGYKTREEAENVRQQKEKETGRKHAISYRGHEDRNLKANESILIQVPEELEFDENLLLKLGFKCVSSGAGTAEYETHLPKQKANDVIHRVFGNNSRKISIAPEDFYESVNEGEQSLADTKKKIEELKSKISTLKGKEKSDAERNLKGEESYLRYLESKGVKEAAIVGEITQALRAQIEPEVERIYKQTKATSMNTFKSILHKEFPGVDDVILGEIILGVIKRVHNPNVTRPINKANEGPNGGSPFQQEGHWSDSLTEDCVIKPGEVYKFNDGEELHVDRVEGQTIVFSANGREESMQYEEFDHLLHSGELKKVAHYDDGQDRLVKENNELAEKLFLVRELIQRKPGTLTEKQKTFIKETLKIQLTESQRDEVEKIIVKRFGDLMK